MDQSKTYQMTHPAPMVWSHVVTPRPERKDNKGRVFKAAYEGTFVFAPDHPDWAAISAMLRAEAAAVVPNVEKPNFPADVGSTIADAAKTKNRDREWARGKILLQAKSSVAKMDGSLLMPPRLFVLLNGKYESFGVTNERSLASKYFYSGVLAVGTFSVAGYEGMGGGVAVYLNEVLSLNAGDRIAGGVDPDEKYGDASKFAQYTGHVSSVDPTIGLPI